MVDKDEILDDLDKFGIDEILCQFIVDDNAREVISHYIKRLEKERWKTASNLFKCRKKLKEIKEVVNAKGSCENGN